MYRGNIKHSSVTSILSKTRHRNNIYTDNIVAVSVFTHKLAEISSLPQISFLIICHSSLHAYSQQGKEKDYPSILFTILTH